MSQSIILGGGCFWCVEAIYVELKGVSSAVSGYAGGHVENPSYEEVCAKRTGHAEVVDVRFDPEIVSLKEILEIFFVTHDPTTPDRQGNDVGPQYRSVVYHQSDEQKVVTEKVIAEFNEKGVWGNPIVTEVEPLKILYRAEEHHQNYFAKNPTQGYCNFIIRPKVAKFRKEYYTKLKS